MSSGVLALSQPVDGAAVHRRAVDFGIDRAALAYAALLGLEMSDAVKPAGKTSAA